MRGSHPLPDQLPGEHTGPHHTLCSIPSNNCLQCCHTYTHSLMVDRRSTVVGHVPMVHMCSFMCTNHIDMIAHTPAFNKLGSTLHGIQLTRYTNSISLSLSLNPGTYPCVWVSYILRLLFPHPWVWCFCSLKIRMSK